VNGNFVDMCVLEWCKLFADRNGKHFWGTVVTAPDSFKAGLRHLRLDEGAFQNKIEEMRRLRDKHIAHQDSDSIGYTPKLDIAKKAVWFYHAQVVNQEANRADLERLPVELDAGYAECEEEAKAIYRRAAG
jgi:hypothetical protein